jgi:hypothetical protein
MAAPRGNLFAIGNNGGRPPMYKTSQEIAEKIAEYLDWEDEAKGLDAKGTGKGIYTLSGCALFLGYCSKASMDDQSKRGDEFSNVISRFKLFMTHWNEQKLYWGGTYMGSQFWLRNWGGYKDESTQNQNQTITSVQPTVVTSGISLSSDEKQIK